MTTQQTRICDLAQQGLSEEIRQDIEKIATILLRHGAHRIILYGSLARGDYRPDSDIDVCVEGIPDDQYFRVLAECLMRSAPRVSVLNFEDTSGYFRQRVIDEGKILYERG